MLDPDVEWFDTTNSHRKELIMKAAIPLAAVLGLAVLVAAAPNEPKKPGVLSVLSVGQKVCVKEVAGGYQIGAMPGLELGHKVTALGPDFLVVEDVTGVVETRIPIFAIRSVTVTRVERGK